MNRSIDLFDGHCDTVLMRYLQGGNFWKRIGFQELTLSRRDGGWGIGACGLRGGELGGIFVKIPPKTSKNVLL